MLATPSAVDVDARMLVLPAPGGVVPAAAGVKGGVCGTFPAPAVVGPPLGSIGTGTGFGPPLGSRGIVFGPPG